MSERNYYREGIPWSGRTAVGQRARPAVPASEKQYRLLFERNPCPMWICDEITHEFLDVNEAALRLYGWPRKAFLQMTAKDIRPAEDVPNFLRVVSGQRKSRATFIGEWRHLKRDGS